MYYMELNLLRLGNMANRWLYEQEPVIAVHSLCKSMWLNGFVVLIGNVNLDLMYQSPCRIFIP